MEIVLRALVVFMFLWVITRAVGRSTLGELSTFELLLYVTMGDLVAEHLDTAALTRLIEHGPPSGLPVVPPGGPGPVPA